MSKVYYYLENMITGEIMRTSCALERDICLSVRYRLLDKKQGETEYLRQTQDYLVHFLTTQSTYYINIKQKDVSGCIRRCTVFVVDNNTKKMRNITSFVSIITNQTLTDNFELSVNCYSHDVITDVITKFYNRVFNTKLDYVDVEFI